MILNALIHELKKVWFPVTLILLAIVGGIVLIRNSYAEKETDIGPFVEVKILAVDSAYNSLLETTNGIRFWWAGTLGGSNEVIKLPEHLVEKRIKAFYRNF